MSQEHSEATQDYPIVVPSSARHRMGQSLLAMAEKALRSRLSELLKNEKRTRAENDIEALHDMRVASRRLREALRIYADLYSQKKLKQGKKDVRRVTRILGLVREVDVNVEQLKKWQGRLGEGYAIPVEYCLAMEQSRQRRLRKKMFAKLDEVDPDTLRADLSKLLQHPHRLSRPREVEPGSELALSYVLFARHFIEAGLGAIRSDVEAVSSKPTLHNYHRLRIQVKKFRYSLELLSRAFDSHRAVRILKQLKSLQDELGALHDCSVLHSTVRAYRAQLRRSELSHLERQLLRLMRVLARAWSSQKKTIDSHLRRLALLRFFERIPTALKEEKSSPAIQSTPEVPPVRIKARH
ncbi:MAG: CHAD domain-containing protein [Acidobacteriia bacterium]|nr:CHAD domain-containing protein [Terriglobia bacterium]